jgi:hypothetical protein
MKKQEKMVSDASQATLSREELEQHLRARAWKDEAFRQEFLANPKAVLKRDYAQYFPERKLPSDLSIKVIEEEEQTLCFVLPLKFSADQLSELECIDDEEILGVPVGGAPPTIPYCNTIVYTCRCTRGGCGVLNNL